MRTTSPDADTAGVPTSQLNAREISTNNSSSLIPSLVSKLTSITHPTKPADLEPNACPSVALLQTREKLTGFLVEVVTLISTLYPTPHSHSHKYSSESNGGGGKEKQEDEDEDEDEEGGETALPPRSIVDQLLLLIPIAYLNRALTHARLGYHDLSSSDAYRAMLSVERFREWTDEAADKYEFLDLDAGTASHGLFSGGGLAGVLHPELRWVVRGDEVGKDTKEDDSQRVLNQIDKASLWTIICSLTNAGCIKLAQTYLRNAVTRFSSEGDVGLWQDLARGILTKLDPHPTSTPTTGSFIEILLTQRNLPIRGLSRREVYPWNHYEPDRFAPSTLEKINASMRECCVLTGPEGGPWCEARCVELPRLRADGTISSKTVRQLGVFALRDIPAVIPGVDDSEPVPHPYLIEPTRLIAYTTTGGPPGSVAAVRCELCTKPIPEPEQGQWGCAECEENDIWPSYCSKECQDRAGVLYHPVVCGMDWTWLHREANRKLEGAKGEEGVFDDDAVYCLLVMRAWAVALVRGVHPLELEEVWYLYGAGRRRKGGKYPILDGTSKNDIVVDEDDEEGEDVLIPFDFHQNVIVPHMILDAFQIEILPFPPHPEDKTDETLDRSPTLSLTHFDTPTSTLPLLNKFKGVASLTRHLDTRTHPPVETLVSAIHPLYSLVNHDCDPNVYWQVNERGEMCFRALDKERKFWLEDGVGGKGGWEGGVEKGRQIRDSYVDPGLGVRERRKKIWGVLGGSCRCGRCEREEREEYRG
ncbi:hypothetical protein L211DRAFT_868750 [Terfezia boudieri ATCC MYA-4762]|uniref:MYND-type zinc finger protein samB n=1 Tax=Terfezia boudieri ATCC MYA-4762 TaxID=1051890 RepID=A0A3N4LK61_9PEZI|nr:hypothetical protein L211DRAFT_868750 [Terfezia boudieri ATCC MYA-4762]